MFHEEQQRFLGKDAEIDADENEKVNQEEDGIDLMEPFIFGVCSDETEDENQNNCDNVQGPLGEKMAISL